MSSVLLFLFIFQSALAFAFTFFIVRLVTGGKKNDVVVKARNLCLPFLALIPGAAFVAFDKSLPVGEPVTTAFWPAIWIFMIILAIVSAMTLANRTKEQTTA